MQHDLHNAKKELATYIGPQAMLPIIQPPVFLQHVGNPSSSSSSSAVMQHNMLPLMRVPTAAGLGQLVMREPQQHQISEAQQQLAAVIAAREHQEMFKGHHGGQGQQPEIVRFNDMFQVSGSATTTGFNQITGAAATMPPPSLALGSFENSYQIQAQQDHHHLQEHLLLQSQQAQLPQNHQQQPQRSGSEEARSIGKIE
ncbi:hypothetical protein V6N11_049139 [Hibiscus sabdariffa]|uniref:Uncharacterized protein n=2 Tax=Hibiscus sabdariffa TaxID=183260 RepID=A0ABR2AMW6_9ROSI